jgi:hypothetical protein
LRFQICFDVDIFEFENGFDVDILALEGIGRIFWIKIADFGYKKYKRPGHTHTGNKQVPICDLFESITLER